MMRYISGVAKIEYNNSKCKGCGRCVEVCPHAVFAMQNKIAVLLDKDACMECGACAKNCEYGAIKVDAGVGCAGALIASMLKGNKNAPSCG